MIGLGCCSECAKAGEGRGSNMYGIAGLGADATLSFPWATDPSVTYDPTTMYGESYDPSLTQYSQVPPVAANINTASGHPLVDAGISNAFAAGVKVFSSIFTPKPAYQQITPQGSTTIWGATPTGVPGLNLSVPGGGLSITTIALLGVAAIGVFAMMGNK